MNNEDYITVYLVSRCVRPSSLANQSAAKRRVHPQKSAKKEGTYSPGGV